MRMTQEDSCRKYQKKKSRSLQPRVLNCGHNLCEECLRFLTKSQNLVPCPVCRVYTVLPEGVEDVVTKVPVDFYTCGVVISKSLVAQRQQNIMPKMVPAGYIQANSMQRRNSSSNSSSEIILCAECGSGPAVWKCRQCTFNLCNPCFVEIHKASKILSKHEAIPIFRESGCRIIRTCDEHDQPLEFYCTEDEHLVCAHCLIMGSHKNHSSMTLQEKNLGYLEELKALMDKVQNVSKHLKKSEKKLKNCSNPYSNMDSSEIIKNINANFHQLHGLLQIRESKLISEVEEIFDVYNSPIEKLKTEIAESLKNIKALLKDSELAKQAPEKYDIKQLMKKLQNTSSVSCHLITTDKSEKNVAIKFSLEKDILDIFNEIGKINGSLQTKYKLQNTDELPADFELSESEDEGSVSDSSSKLSSLVDLDSIGEEKSPGLAQDSKSQQSLPQLQMLKQEMVFVTHIVNPHLFMVQRCQQANTLLPLSKEINEWCENLPKSTRLTSVNKDDLVLAQYTKDNLWYRGRIKKVIRKKIEENDPSNEIEGVEVCYIDYGNSEYLPLSKLCEMEVQFMHLPEIALKCSLHDILPKDKTWSLEAIEMMRMFTGEKPVQMCVMEEISGVYQVDLRRPPALNLSINDTPTSVRDALVFLQFGVFAASNSSPYEGMIPHQQFLSPIPHRKFKSINVAASYADNPSIFYVQQTGDNWNSLSSLMFSMQEKYKGDAKNNLWTIFCPQLNMPCVAQYSHDRHWYRARVEELIGGTRVKVKYVDYGNEEVLPWSSLKKIADEYLKLPIQAIRCSLIDVEPLDGMQWSTKACLAFNDMLANKELKIYIKGETDTGLSVALYENRSDASICINTLLVTKGLAKSTGPNSTLLKFAPDIKDDDSTVHGREKTLVARNILSPAIEIKPKPVVVKKPDYPEMVLVKVTSVESPDCVYVQLMGENEEDLNRLMVDMQRTYQHCERKSYVWKCEEFVAAKLRKDRQWFRAKILAVEDTSLKVFAYDYGLTSYVSVENVQPLLNKFLTKYVFAISCCLGGIQPAGGTTTWTKMACECLQEIVQAHDKFYMAKKGSLKNGRLTVDLHAEILQPGGALEPHISSFQSITELLIEQGVALHSRRKSVSPVDQLIKESVLAAAGDSVLNDPSKLIISIEDLNQQMINRNFECTNEMETETSQTLTQVVDGSGTSQSNSNLNELIQEQNEYVDIKEKNEEGNNEVDGDVNSGDDDDMHDGEDDNVLTKNECHHDDLTEGNEIVKKKKMNFFDFDDDDSNYSDDDDYDNDEEADELFISQQNVSSNPREIDNMPSELLSDEITLTETEVENSGSIQPHVSLNSSLKLPVVKRTDVVWKRSELPKETVFNAVITYIDYDGCIYLHNVGSKPILDLIKTTLKNKFSNSKPEDHDFYWEPDEPCIAQYHLDECWYRAQVKNVTDKGVQLVFIDYGNTETVDPLMIRKKITCAGFPRQSLKCMLYGIKPISDSALWPEQVLEVLHNQIVEKEVTVVLKEPPTKEPLQVSILLAQNNCATLEEWLIEMELAEKQILPSPCFSPVDYCIEDREGDPLELSPFYTSPLPSLGENVNAVVTHIEFPSVVWLQRKADDKLMNEQQTRISEQCLKFLKLCQRINQEVNNWPLAHDLKIGDAVCSHYSVDNQWYRALVQNVQNNEIQVLYVDYGNQAKVQCDQIRQLPDEFWNLPMQALRCQLHQLAPTFGQWTEEKFHELESTISLNQGNVICCIKELSNPVKVDLYKNPDDDCYHLQLVYQELIDKGIMTLVREKTPDELL